MAVLCCVGAGACELTEATIVDFADVVVVEAYVTVAEVPGDNALRVFIHGTAPGGEPSSQTFDAADLTVTAGDGTTTALSLTSLAECVFERPDGATGSCFAADAVQAAAFEAGEALSIEVSLADGRSLSGSTRVPGAFALSGVSATCSAEPDTRLPLAWSRADSAYAYVSEALIFGLGDALAGEGIEAPDTVDLVGLSISERDTTVSFPNEFGVFDRFDLERDLAVRLQDGIPEGTRAEIAVTAVDRNYVNWVRGGNFNPSGPVRVSSLVGDGSGVFGSAVTRTFTIVSTSDTTVAPACAVE